FSSGESAAARAARAIEVVFCEATLSAWQRTQFAVPTYCLRSLAPVVGHQAVDSILISVGTDEAPLGCEVCERVDAPEDTKTINRRTATEQALASCFRTGPGHDNKRVRMKTYFSCTPPRPRTVV